jgi:hypothetical protein
VLCYASWNDALYDALYDALDDALGDALGDGLGDVSHGPRDVSDAPSKCQPSHSTCFADIHAVLGVFSSCQRGSSSYQRGYDYGSSPQHFARGGSFRSGHYLNKISRIFFFIFLRRNDSKLDYKCTTS